MVFSSVVFLFYFFPVVLFFYFISGKSARNIVLLLASIIFYAWGEPHFVIVLLISIMINYVIGILIEKLQMKSYKKIILLFGLIANLGILFYFKYVNFFIQIINDIISRLMINFRIHTIDIALPIGLSFFIFQEISYIIDVYRGDVPAQNKIISLALYISMFPQLIAGPIVRYSDVYKEIDSRSSSIDDVYYGLRRFIMGLGEKVIIADILANEVKLIFENVQLSMGGGNSIGCMDWCDRIYISDIF